MQKIVIDRYRIIPSPITGIGWVAVERWDDSAGAYHHVSTFRTKNEAELFIQYEETAVASVNEQG